MADTSFMSWPFFEDRHRGWRDELAHWAAATLPALIDHHDVDGSCRRLVAALGDGGWLRAVVPGGDGPRAGFDVRTLCLARETLAYESGLADFAFAMQGLGTGPISLFGSEDLKKRYLGRVARGEAIAAFALSETDAGSDVAAMTTTADLDFERRHCRPLRGVRAQR